MKTVSLGSQGMKVSRIGFGCMGLSQFYGEVPSFAQAEQTLHRAVDLGITLFDTADIYGAAAALFGRSGPGFGHNEELLGRVLAPFASRVAVATRFGAYVDDAGKIALSGRPAYVRSACEASLRRLRVETIQLYAYTRLDPTVAIEETVGAMGDLVREGKVRYLGLSEMGSDIIRRAHATHPLTSVESEYSLWVRAHEADVIATCRGLGIGFLAYSPLGRGMLTGTLSKESKLGADDFRSVHPMFQGESFDRNRALVSEVERLAEARGKSTGQLALAWVLSRGEHVVPIPGTKRASYVEENVAATELQLTAEELTTLESIFDPDRIAGERHRGALELR